MFKNSIATLILLFLLSACMDTKDLPNSNEQKDKIDFVIDYEQLKDYFVSTNNVGGQQLRFRAERKDRLSNRFDLVFAEDFLTQNQIAVNGSPVLFYIDMDEKDDWGVYAIHENPHYFKHLEAIDATSLKKGRHLIGQLNTDFQETGISHKSLVRILLKLPIIKSYAHLHADFYLLEEADQKEMYSVSYKVEWHYCTNDCFDPVYKMKIEVDKKTGEIVVIGL